MKGNINPGFNNNGFSIKPSEIQQKQPLINSKQQNQNLYSTNNGNSYPQSRIRSSEPSINDILMNQAYNYRDSNLQKPQQLEQKEYSSNQNKVNTERSLSGSGSGNTLQTKLSFNQNNTLQGYQRASIKQNDQNGAIFRKQQQNSNFADNIKFTPLTNTEAFIQQRLNNLGGESNFSIESNAINKPQFLKQKLIPDNNQIIPSFQRQHQNYSNESPVSIEITEGDLEDDDLQFIDNPNVNDHGNPTLFQELVDKANMNQMSQKEVQYMLNEQISKDKTMNKEQKNKLSEPQMQKIDQSPPFAKLSSRQPYISSILSSSPSTYNQELKIQETKNQVKNSNFNTNNQKLGNNQKFSAKELFAQ